MTAFVCLHGFTGTPAAFAPLDLGDAWAPYLCGHGGDPELSTRTFDEEVARIGRGIEARARSPVHLVAYSMGARLALGLLLASPGLFARATLLGVNPGLEDEGARQERLGWEARWIDVLEQDGLAVFEHKWQAQALFATQHSLPPRSQDAQRSARLSHTAGGLVHALNVLGLGSMPNYWPRLGDLSVPTRLLYGALDEKFAVIAQRAARSAPNITSSAIPDVGHNPLLEAPQAIRQAIVATEDV